MSEPKGFVIFGDYEKHISLLSDEDRGKLFSALLRYFNTGEILDLSPMRSMAFSFIQTQIDRDREKYAEISARRSESGKRGMRSRWSAKKEQDTNEYNCISNDSKNNNCYNEITKITNHNITNTITNTNTNTNKREIDKEKRFKKPTLAELEQFSQDNALFIDCEHFLNYYESNGWMVGKNHMKDWRRTARNWRRRDSKPNTSRVTPNPTNNTKKPYGNLRKEDIDDTFL